MPFVLIPSSEGCAKRGVGSRGDTSVIMTHEYFWWKHQGLDTTSPVVFRSATDRGFVTVHFTGATPWGLGADAAAASLVASATAGFAGLACSGVVLHEAVKAPRTKETWRRPPRRRPWFDRLTTATVSALASPPDPP